MGKVSRGPASLMGLNILSHFEAANPLTLIAISWCCENSNSQLSFYIKGSFGQLTNSF